MPEDNPFQSPRANLADADQSYCETPIFGFAGRIGRLRYLSFTFVSSIVVFMASALVIGVLAGFIIPNLPKGDNNATTTIILTLVYLAVLAGILAIQAQYGVRRLHDLNRSGWIWLLMLLPLLNLFLFFYLLFASGTKSNNKYGPPPPANTVAVWIGAMATLFLVPASGLFTVMAINESNDYRMRSYGRVAQAEFSNLLTNLIANSGSAEETRTFLANLQKGEVVRFTALEVQTTGDTVKVQIKKPTHWEAVRFVLNARISKDEVQWQCATEGASSRSNDLQLERLQTRCRELQ